MASAAMDNFRTRGQLVAGMDWQAAVAADIGKRNTFVDIAEGPSAAVRARKLRRHGTDSERQTVRDGPQGLARAGSMRLVTPRLLIMRCLRSAPCHPSDPANKSEQAQPLHYRKASKKN